MKPIQRWYFFIGFLLLAPLFSCGGVARQQTLIHPAQYSGGDESGIGGTGMLANNSGIGGTGIIGEITGFGSIFVNGVEVELDSQTRLNKDGMKISKHNFARGEIVILRSEKSGTLNIAREIHIRHEVIGQVEKVLPLAHRIIVLGQLIDTRLLPSLPQVGAFIQVSGYRDKKGIIHARHITISDNHKQSMLLGKIRLQNKKWYIGQQQLQLLSGSQLQQGQTVRIQGALVKNVLQVKNIQYLKGLPFNKPVRNILIQGLLQKSGTAQYTISGYTFDVAAHALQKQLLKKINRLVQLQLTNSKQVWQLNRILNKQQLPMGRPLPAAIPHNRPQQPVRPRVPTMPHSVPNRFYR